MNDLKDLLELALPEGHGQYPPQLADPAGDLARGRRLLRRQRLGRLSAGAAVVVAAALVPLAVNSIGHAPAIGPGQASKTAGPTGPAANSPRNSGIALVRFEGRQPPGYQVAEVPRGWVIQGGNAYALVIAPKGDKDTNTDSFAGKLVVMLQSQAAGAPTTGIPQPVAGRPGRFDVQGDTQILIYQDAKGRWVVIQAPTSLGWGSARLARFAAGVQVLRNARQGQG